jgi:hypothetical protein
LFTVMKAVRAKVEIPMGNVLFDQGIVLHGSALRVTSGLRRCAGGWGGALLKRYNPHIIY